MMFLLLLQICFAKNYAILLNPSKGILNYRHMANIHVMNTILRNNNYKADDILAYYPEDAVIRSTHKNPVIANIPIHDLQREGHTISDFLNGIRCNNKKLMYVSKSDNMLIYMCGHGNKGVLKFYDKEWLTVEDLFDSIQILSNRCNKVLLLLDTCQAETMVYRNTHNVYVVTTSIENESSYSSHYNDDLGMSAVDNFIYILTKVLIKNDCYTKSLNVLFRQINDHHIGSTLTWTNDSSFLISDFFVQHTTKSM